MLSQVIDITSDLNTNHTVNLDVSQWQNATIHLSGTPSGTISIKGTNDSGAVQGVSDGDYVSAANFTLIQATKLSDGTSVTAIASADNYKVVIATRFIQIGGSSAATTGKVIVFLNTVT